MGLLQDASLIVTPNAYKAGKLYSVVPSDGTGDFTVTRATSATRVNSLGLIEIPVTNLLLQSEEFTNIIWFKGQSSVIENTAIAPNNTLTADTFTANGINAVHSINQTLNIVNGTIYFYSVYVKKNTNNFIQLALAGTSFGLNVWANFNLNTGVIGSVGSSTTNVKIENFNNDWYRCSISGLSTTTGVNPAPILNIVTSESSVRGESNTLATSVYIWGAQLEQNVSATEYIPTTSVVRTRFAGITQDGSIASNIPRLDYTNGSCPSILVEPQRTNLFTYSEEFNNSIWLNNQTTILANTSLSPSNIVNADKLVLNNTTAGFNTLQNINVTSGVTYTMSCYFKKEEIKYIQFTFGGSFFSNSGYANFDLETGTVSVLVNGTAKISQSANGYWRCEFTNTATSTGTGLALFAPQILPNASRLQSVTNTGANGLYIWGAQLEAGGNATSYIPTTTAAVTRNADLISKSGISNLIGQTEGSIYCEINHIVFNQNSGIFVLQNSINQADNRIGFRYTASPIGAIGAFIRTGTNIVVNLFTPYIPTIGQKYKMCFTYNQTVQKLFVNGTLVSNTTGGYTQPNTLDEIQLGTMVSGLTSNVGINSALVFKNVLSDAQAIQLTTL